MNIQESENLSFIVPSKNEGERLLKCIESIYQNYRKGDEVIVVDNGSTDGSPSIVSSTFSGVNIVAVSTGKVGRLRNIGFSHSRNNIICFVDGDIELGPSWREELTRVLENRSKRFLFGSHVVEPPSGQVYPRGWYDSGIQHMDDTHVNSGHMIVSRELFEELGGFSEELESGEDYDISNRAKYLKSEVFNDQRLLAIHHGFPSNIWNFIKRESWHGMGDFSSLKEFISSKVAVASVLFSTSFVLGMVFLFIGKSVASLVFFSSAVSISLLASFIKYRFLSFQRRLNYSLVMPLYFFSRTMSIFRIWLR